MTISIHILDNFNSVLICITSSLPVYLRNCLPITSYYVKQHCMQPETYEDLRNFTLSPFVEASGDPSTFTAQTDDDDSISDSERSLFEDTGELKALMVLSAGPLISQIAISLYGVVDTMWVARSIGERGTAAIGAVVVIEYIASAIATYLSTCVSAQVSYLFGKGKKKCCSQMYVDFIRLAIFLGLLVPALILPTSKYLLRWFDTGDELIDLACMYLIPSQCGCFGMFLFYMNCGLLEAVGHSGFYAAAQIAAFVLNGFILDPLFLLWLKMPLWSASLARVISQFSGGFLLSVLAFQGKLSIRPKLSMFFKPVVPEFFQGCKTGFADLVEATSLDFPMILVEKYVTQAGEAVGDLDSVLTVWSIINRLEQLLACVSIGIGEGLLPLASYSFGAKNYKRMMWLMIHSLWVMAAWAGVISVVLMAWPKEIARIWGNSPNFLEWAEKMIRIYAYSAVLTSVDYTIPIMLIAMKYTWTASLLSVFGLLVPIPVFSSILYYTKKDDPARIIWTFDIADAFCLIIGGLMMVRPIVMMVKDARLKHQEDETLKRPCESRCIPPPYMYTDYTRINTQITLNTEPE